MITNFVARNKRRQNRLCFADLIVAMAITLLAAGCSERTADMDITTIENPSGEGARLPKLTTTAKGALLSWVEPQPGVDGSWYRLHFASFRAGQWSAPVTIASGNDWFINWADFPSVYKSRTGSLAAHWLQRSSGGTYSYDVKTVQSADGNQWSVPYTPHLDGTKTEHGFASYFSMGTAPAIVWLDGRRTQPAAAHTGQSHAEHGPNGEIDSAMTLRMRVLDESSAARPSTLLDDRVCDCCQTAAINTSGGPVVFYRDRSVDEVRDISYVYFSNNVWSQPAAVHHDGWEISGCPVNGPQADALDGLIAVAWFTGAGGKQVVNLALSRQLENGFETPFVVSQEAPLGRLDVIRLTNHTTLVAWFEDDTNGMATIRAALFNTDGRIGDTLTITPIQGARASGFLQLARVAPQTALLAFTDVETDGISTTLLSAPGIK